MLGRSHLTALALVGWAATALAQTQPATQPAQPAPHQHGGMPHDHGTAADFGVVSFPISCAPAVQPTFTRAVAMLHSFWYDEASKTFAEVAAKDPSCAMAHWGVAMTWFRPVWAPPTAAEFAKGREAVIQAITLAEAANTSSNAKSNAKGLPARERDYVRAIAAYFNNPVATSPRERALAYELAMSELHAKYPDDDEGAIFYALSLLGTAQASDKTYANQKKGAELLNGVLPRHPRHPGVAHYLIHSFDSPPLAPMALEAARVYAKIAPASPHARHMPSHIFIRLGLWEDSIGSNLASAEAARAHVAKTNPGAMPFDELHALDYLVYAWLQRGEDDKARATIERVASTAKLDLPNFAAAYALAAIPGRYALERRAWAEAAAIEPRQPAIFPWDTIPYAEASAWYARGLGAARSGNVTVARDASAKLAALKATMVAKQDPYWPNQIEIQRLATDAWIARAEKRDDDALRLMRESADLEASTEKHPVTPGALLPSRELLGDLLLDLGKADEALREYEASLAVAPKRLNTLYGAARAAQQLQQRDKAKRYYSELVSLCEKGASRPSIVEARAFLASE
jgi:tetratricopeptide (TPR) repeat protein